MDDLDGRIESLESSQNSVRSELRKMDRANPRRRSTRLERKAGKIIDGYARGRRCPSCSRKLMADRAWKIGWKHKSAICCRCFRAVVNPNKIRGIFSINDVMFRIDGAALTIARESRGIPLKVFAKLAGWTIEYQIYLEKKSFEVGLDKAEIILEVLDIGGQKVRQRLLQMEWKPIGKHSASRHRRPANTDPAIDAINPRPGTGTARSS